MLCIFSSIYNLAPSFLTLPRVKFGLEVTRLANVKRLQSVWQEKNEQATVLVVGAVTFGNFFSGRGGSI